MTTLRDGPGSGAGGGTDFPGGAAAGPQAAHCPHCGALMEAGIELPWPPEPALCPSCERWVGRARAVAGAGPAATEVAQTQAAATQPPAAAAPSAEAIVEEPGSEPDGGDLPPPRRRRERRSRSSPMGRRARELGPPPVPPFAAQAGHPGLAAYDHEAAPASSAIDGVGGSAETPHHSVETLQRAAGEADPGGWESASSPTQPRKVAPSDVGEDALSTDGDQVAPAEGDGRAGDGLGPPAPFYASGVGVGTDAPTSPGPPDGSPSRAPGAPEGSPDTTEALRRDEPGHTVPFWAVGPQLEPRRRLRLPRLRRPTLHRPRLRRPRLRRPTRAGLLRALPIFLLVVGGLLLVEGAVTVLWKEPFSAIFAARSQSELRDELERLEREQAAQAARSRKEAVAYQRRRAVSLNREVGVGEAIGRLRVKKLGLNEVVVQGTDNTTIQKGPGHYMETPLPGQKGDWTVGIAGHRTTYGAPFRRINELKRGDDIVFTLPYGRFTYEVDRTRIVDAGYMKAMVPQGEDLIVLTACHPLYSAAQRILVYGKLTKSEPRGGARQAAARP